MSVERRTHERYPVWFPVQVDGGQLGTVVGVSKDASAKGVRVQTNATLTVGAPVRLQFRVASHERRQDIAGTIVRSEPSDDDANWPFQLEVEFDHPDPSLDARLRTEVEMQRPRFSA